MFKECFSYTKCNCCTKTAMCYTYQKYKHLLLDTTFNSNFENKVNNPSKLMEQNQEKLF